MLRLGDLSSWELFRRKKRNVIYVLGQKTYHNQTNVKWLQAFLGGRAVAQTDACLSLLSALWLSAPIQGTPLHHWMDTHLENNAFTIYCCAVLKILHTPTSPFHRLPIFVRHLKYFLFTSWNMSAVPLLAGLGAVTSLASSLSMVDLAPLMIIHASQYISLF